MFCCMSCAAKHNMTYGTVNIQRVNALQNKRMLKQASKIGVKKLKDNGYKSDPFKYYIRNSKMHLKQKNKNGRSMQHTVTLQQIKTIWDNQNGKCVLTGWDLVLPSSILGWSSSNISNKQKHASLDRIDSSKGYTKDNVHFVAYIVNMAKNNLKIQKVIEMAHAIHKHYDMIDSIEYFI